MAPLANVKSAPLPALMPSGFGLRPAPATNRREAEGLELSSTEGLKSEVNPATKPSETTLLMLIEPAARTDRSTGCPAYRQELKSSGSANVRLPDAVKSTAGRTTNGRLPEALSREEIAGPAADMYAATEDWMALKSAAVGEAETANVEIGSINTSPTPRRSLGKDAIATSEAPDSGARMSNVPMPCESSVLTTLPLANDTVPLEPVPNSICPPRPVTPAPSACSAADPSICTEEPPNNPI